MQPKENRLLLKSLPEKLHKIWEKMRPRSSQSYAEVLKKIFFEVQAQPEFWIFQFSAYGLPWLVFFWPWYHPVWLVYAYESLGILWEPKKSIRVRSKPILRVIITVIQNSFSLRMAFSQLLSYFFPIFAPFLHFWDHSNRYSCIVFEYWPIDGWEMRKKFRISNRKMSNQVF